MPNCTSSHCTKPYFNIHSADIIISHNGIHCPVLPVLFLCLCRPWLGLSCLFLYSGSLFVVPCLGFQCLDLDHAGCKGSYTGLLGVVFSTNVTFSDSIFPSCRFVVAAPLLSPLVAVVALVRRLV